MSDNRGIVAFRLQRLKELNSRKMTVRKDAALYLRKLILIPFAASITARLSP
jgi:hypothetical protein